MTHKVASGILRIWLSLGALSAFLVSVLIYEEGGFQGSDSEPLLVTVIVVTVIGALLLKWILKAFIDD